MFHTILLSNAANFLDLLVNPEHAATIEKLARDVRHLFQTLVESGQISSYEQLFHVLDEDDTGTLDFNEFRRGISALNLRLTDNDLRSLMNKFDVTRDGLLDVKEFVLFCEAAPNSKPPLVAKDSLAALFGAEKVDDVVHNAARKLRHMFRTVKAQERVGYRDIFAKMDKDGGGTISRKEFVQALQELNFHLTRGEVKRLMDLFDTERRGVIIYHDFLQFCKGENYVSEESEGSQSEEHTARGGSKGGSTKGPRGHKAKAKEGSSWSHDDGDSGDDGGDPRVAPVREQLQRALLEGRVESYKELWSSIDPSQAGKLSKRRFLAGCSHLSDLDVHLSRSAAEFMFSVRAAVFFVRTIL